MGMVGFMVAMALALLMGIMGVVAIFSSSGNTLLGIVLLLAASALSGYAKNARAAYLHRQKMTGLGQWAQGLGPRRRRP